MFLRRQTLHALALAAPFLMIACPRQPKGNRVLFADIVAATPAEYGDYLFKLTYLGPQGRVLKTLVFGSSSPRDVALFTTYRRSGYTYSNDDRPDVLSFAVDVTEVDAMISAIAKDPVFTDGSDRPTPTLSLTIMRAASTAKRSVYESLIPFVDAKRLVADTLAANLATINTDGAKYLRYWSKNVGG